MKYKDSVISIEKSIQHSLSENEVSERERFEGDHDLCCPSKHEIYFNGTKMAKRNIKNKVCFEIK